jgi:uncharacterized protein (TIGR00369 family)
MSGLEFLRGLKEGSIKEPPISMLIGAAVAEVEEGRVVFELTPEEYHCNPFGTVHGGIACSMLDAATGSAVYSMLPAGVGYTSIDLKINYIRPVMVKTGRMLAEGRIIHMGTRVAVAEGRFTDGKGRLYAFGLSTCMIFRSGW